VPASHKNAVYVYRHSADQDAARPVHHPVIVVGAGPSGLTAGIDLAFRGVRGVVLDDNDTVSVGSRAICFSKRTLEIWQRLGCAAPMLEKGIEWRLGKVFFGKQRVFEFNLQPEPGHGMPAFINLQQYYVEEMLIERAMRLGVDLRWRNRVVGIREHDDCVWVDIDTPDGRYVLTADYVVAADGANSPVRDMLGLESAGQVFNDQFLIADVVVEAPFPTERWFWFDPPFHEGQSVLLHRQADNVFRIDFQLGADADGNAALEPASIAPRIRAMLGDKVAWSLDWASVYTFRCRMMERFVHDRVIFVGDAAHQVSPFGARGANGGVQSAENLTWKLARVLRGESPVALLESYDNERREAARENILNSTRATDFITPKSHVSRVFRDSVLRLAANEPFARALVNSGRLSTPCAYRHSPLSTPDADRFEGAARPGAVCPDAPVVRLGRREFLLDSLGKRFTVICSGGGLPEGLRDDADIDVLEVGVDFDDVEGLVSKRLDLVAGGAYLIRPDQYVCARWRVPTADDVVTAWRRACALS